jgi:hypothetical protein
MRQVFAGDDDGIARNLRIGPHKLLVLTGDHEALERLAILKREPLAGVRLTRLDPKSGDGMSRKGAKKKQIPTSRHSPTG